MLMKNNKTAKIAFLIFIIGLVSFMVSHTINVKQEGKREFEKFNTANIDGIIKEISMNVGIVYIQLTEEKFSFDPLTSSLNNHSIFEYTAEEGDRIVKPAYADTLTLITEDTVYKYTFEKFE